MLKITTRIDAAGGTNFELEGTLGGAWVQELESCWRKAPGRPVKILLCAVTFIDHQGKELLAEMHRSGAELVAEGCMNKAVVEKIIQGERT